MTPKTAGSSGQKNRSGRQLRKVKRPAKAVRIYLTRERKKSSDAEVTSSEVSSSLADYFEKVAHHVKHYMVAESYELLDDLPDPAVLAQRVIEESRPVEDSHAYTTDGTALVDTVGPSWTIDKLRKELGGVSYQAVHQRVGRGTLLGLPTSDGVTVYPLFQFVRTNGKLTVRPGLLQMFKILKEQEPWQVAVLLNTPAPELEDHTPVEWEKNGGDIEHLEQLATVLKQEMESNASFERGTATSA